MFKWFRKKPIITKDSAETKSPESSPTPGIFSSEFFPAEDIFMTQSQALSRIFQRSATDDVKIKPIKSGMAMDEGIDQLKSAFASSPNAMSPIIYNWYASQSFIGHQTCAIIAQHWLVSKACGMPGEDAIRNGYELSINKKTDIDPDILEAIREYDVQYNITANLLQFVRMGRVFGIRIAMFKIESSDPEYYAKPFNIDGVMPGSYKGLSQIDPYWVAPELDIASSADPSSIYFYEPTWWLIHGRRVHRTHLIIMRRKEVTDILKPTYYYGGVPLPQEIFTRVYAAERTADEAPQLALAKRAMVMHVDIDAAIANQASFDQRMAAWSYYMNNFGIKVVGKEEKVEQFDTSLADLDEVIMTQYQLVAAIAEVPAVKLLGTSPKGFNTTGEFEEASYHEHLKSIQTHYLTPLLDRHHLLLIKSEILPKYGAEDFNVRIVWASLDSTTGKEKAEINLSKAQTGVALVQSGAIDGEDERQRVTQDPDSGYNGLKDREVLPEDPTDPEFTNTDPQENLPDENDDHDTFNQTP